MATRCQRRAAAKAKRKAHEQSEALAIFSRHIASVVRANKSHVPTERERLVSRAWSKVTDSSIQCKLAGANRQCQNRPKEYSDNDAALAALNHRIASRPWTKA